MNKYKQVEVKKKGKLSKDKVAVIYAEGGINTGKGEDGSIGSDSYAKIIEKVRTDDDVKAIVLRVNSGGGSALASEIIWREISLAKEKGIPVVASMASVAASGGYYISCLADTIVALPNTVTGSIGVFGLMANMSEFYNDKLGFTFDTVKTTKYSDFPTSVFLNRSLTQEEGAVIQRSVDEIYSDFLVRVGDGRSMDTAAVHKVAQGRVWTGVQAQKNGLVDVLGGIEEAIAIAANMAGLEEGDYRMRTFPEEQDPIEKLLKNFMGETKQHLIKEELGDQYRYYKVWKDWKSMNGVQARMPFEIEVH